jgi:TolB protein
VKPATATTRPKATATLAPKATATTGHTGGQIVFISCMGHNSLGGGTQCGIYIIDADGSNIRQLTNNDSDGDVSLSPDGTRVLFVRQGQHYDIYEIYEIHTDGSNLTLLTNNPGQNLEPTWSPDGSQIAFMSNLLAPNDPAHIFMYVMGADGSNPHRLTQSSGSSPQWSPDGSQIVFVTYISNISTTLHIMNADGTHPQVIKTSPSFDISMPRWSPDGTKIAFINQKTNGDPVKIEVDVINKDGTNQHSLTAGFDPIYDGLSWSPDGQQLIFNMNGDGKSWEGATHIFVVNADGSDLHMLKVGCPGYSCANADWGH